MFALTSLTYRFSTARRVLSLLLIVSMLLPLFGCVNEPTRLVEDEFCLEETSNSSLSSFAPSPDNGEYPPTESSSASESSTASSEESTSESSSETSKESEKSSASSSESSSQESQTHSEKSENSSESSGSSSSSSSQVSSESSQDSQSSQSSQAPQESQNSQSEQPVINPVASSSEMRAMWFSYLDLSPMLKGKNKAQFTSAINTAFDNVVSLGLNTVIVQVRPFADALYNSEYFPWSVYISGTQGVAPGFDPLSVMIQCARARKLRIEAWVNPYRVKTSGNSTSSLSADNPAKRWLAEGSDAVIVTANGIYFNPASPDAQQLIINGVKELVRNYDIDGIHFDDYFYPSPDASFDAAYYSQYQSSGGSLSLGDWRRENVNILVRNVYAAIKTIDSSVAFGISPQGNMSNNYNTQYIDVAKWVTNSGYIDYIMPQIYFGFNNSGCPYVQTVAKWNNLITNKNIKLYIGLSPYKIGTVDNYAGAGKNEWINNSDILSRQVSAARGNNRYGGFALFRYASVFAPASNVASQVSTEINNLKKVLG